MVAMNLYFIGIVDPHWRGIRRGGGGRRFPPHGSGPEVAWRDSLAIPNFGTIDPPQRPVGVAKRPQAAPNKP